MNLLQDLRYSARMLMKHPGFTIVVVLTLALGIGANTAIFSLANAVLFRPLHVAEPERVMSLYSIAQDGTQSNRFSWLDYLDHRERNEVFSGMSAQMQTLLTFGERDQVEQIFGEVATGNYFSLLGLRTILGRTFNADEDQPGAEPVTVISFNFWQRRFGGDPSVIGRTVHFNGELFTIIGVLQAGYTGTRVIPAVEAWVPLQRSGTWLGPDWQTNRAAPSLQVVGRLKPGVTREQAQAAMTVVTRQLAQAYPTTNKAIGVALERTSLAEGRRRSMISTFLTILLAVTGLVLLIACANVANLVLVRSIGRQRELAVRQALGASRARLVRQFLTEGVLLALLGGATGLLISVYAASRLLDFNPVPTFPLKFDLSVDLRVLGFSLLVSLLTGLLLSLAPLMRLKKFDLLSALKEDARSGASNPQKARLRNFLAVGQTALSLVLLIGAGLLLKSLQNMQEAEPGFDPNNVIAMDFDLSLKGLNEEQGRRYYQTMLERISALPGVESVSLSNRAPLDISTPTLGAQIEGHFPPPGKENIPLSFYRITPGYFQTMKISLVKGRDLTARDNERSPRVAIINETLARQFWPTEEVIGKRFRVAAQSVRIAGEINTEGEVEIIGVAKDSKYRTLGEDPTPLVYLPFWQNYNDGMALLVRSAGAPKQMIRTVQGELLLLDKQPQGFFARTMHEHMAVVLAPGKIAATLFGLSGLLALLLASIGLYGVISYSVRQRIQEMGIRMALGARPSDIFKMVVGQGLRIALVGIAVGLAAALALTRFLSSLLFAVSATDPVTFGAASLLLVVVALLACYLPARRATKVDPLVALRYE
jgi:macrolide transport system ATP-binding/permease protein